MAEDCNNDNDIFVYMGEGGPVVPSNIICAKVHPSVTELVSTSFNDRRRLEEVELCDGLVHIGRHAFEGCHKLRRVNIPSTVSVINNYAFSGCRKLEDFELSEGVENICKGAFASCRSLYHITLPSTLRTIEEDAFEDCKILFSAELSENIYYIGGNVFNGCKSLRNIAIPNDVIIADEKRTFRQCTDLKQLFGTQEEIVNALQHRFDSLPIHKMIYYHSYNDITPDQLINATDTSGKHQDSLGMTPLHILACSTVQNIELYRVLIEKYPENLITGDKWGALPLFYVLWGRAPDEIVQFLVESYKSLYPDKVFNWTNTIVILFLAAAPLKVMLKVQEESFPGQAIDWDTIFEMLSIPGEKRTLSSKNRFRRLVKYGMAGRICAIGIKQWRDELIDILKTDIKRRGTSLRAWLDGVKSKLVQYEEEYSNLKEATTILELVIWKKKMNDHCHGEQRCNKEMTNNLRVNCGADIVIGHMLPYLMPACPTDDITPHPISTTGPTETGSHFGNFVFQGYDQPL